ncbi:MAG: hypothetical protein JWP10_1663 [Nocardioidaceae bacterium]|nr:hypothetical protein [Nocardioidaceae bacterium]
MSRILRSSLVVACIVSISSLAHASAGGSVASIGAVTALAVMAFPVVFLLSSHQMSARTLTLTLAASQVFFHAAHMYLSSFDPHMAHMSGMSTGISIPMVCSHAVAVAIMALLLSRGERLVWTVWSWMVPLLRARPGLTQWAAVRLQSASPATDLTSFFELFASRALSRRGPPAFV